MSPDPYYRAPISRTDPATSITFFDAARFSSGPGFPVTAPNGWRHYNTIDDNLYFRADGRWVALFYTGQNVFYVSKAGNDANGGQNPNDALLTLAEAVSRVNAQTPSSTNRFRIEILDGGIYVAAITLPTYTILTGESATTQGTVELSEESAINLFEMTQQLTGGALIEVNGAFRGYADVRRLIAGSSQGGCQVTVSGGELFLSVDHGEATGAQSIIGTAASDEGRIMATFGDLDTSFAAGIRTGGTSIFAVGNLITATIPGSGLSAILCTGPADVRATVNKVTESLDCLAGKITLNAGEFTGVITDNPNAAPALVFESSDGLLASNYSAGHFPSFYYTTVMMNNAPSAGIASLVGFIFWVPLAVPKRRRYDQLGISVVTGDVGGDFRAAVYDNNNGIPGNLIVETAALPCTASTIVVGSITEDLDPGWYWLGFQTDSATATFRSSDNNIAPHQIGFTTGTAAMLATCWIKAQAFGAFPAPPHAGIAPFRTFAPLVMVRTA